MLDITKAAPGIMGRPTIWLPEHIEYLRELFGLGRSPAVAADAINEKFATSFTRNAVIGKAHRNTIEIPRSHIRDPRNIRKPRVRKARIARGSSVRPPRVIVPDIVDQLIPFEQRKTIETIEMHDCRWPVGDPGTPEFFFCGAPKMETSSYCAAHHQRSVGRTPSVRRPNKRGHIEFGSRWLAV